MNKDLFKEIDVEKFRDKMIEHIVRTIAFHVAGTRLLNIRLRLQNFILSWE